MGNSIPVRVGDQIFASKLKLTAHMQELMARYSLGDRLSDADTKFCLALFAWHSEKERKRVRDVVRIEVRPDIYGNKYFQIFRKDGTDEDISWTHCVKNATTTA